MYKIVYSSYKLCKDSKVQSKIKEAYPLSSVHIMESRSKVENKHRLVGKKDGLDSAPNAILMYKLKWKTYKYIRLHYTRQTCIIHQKSFQGFPWLCCASIVLFGVRRETAFFLCPSIMSFLDGRVAGSDQSLLFWNLNSSWKFTWKVVKVVTASILYFFVVSYLEKKFPLSTGCTFLPAIKWGATCCLLSREST